MDDGLYLNVRHDKVGAVAVVATRCSLIAALAGHFLALARRCLLCHLFLLSSLFPLQTSLLGIVQLLLREAGSDRHIRGVVVGFVVIGFVVVFIIIRTRLRLGSRFGCARCRRRSLLGLCTRHSGCHSGLHERIFGHARILIVVVAVGLLIVYLAHWRPGLAQRKLAAVILHKLAQHGDA